MRPPVIVRLGLSLTLLLAASAVTAQTWSVLSPDGRILLGLALDQTGGTAGQRLSYWVEQGAEGQRVIILQRAPLGIRFDLGQFVQGLGFDAAQPQRVVEENYVMPHGKRRLCHNRANQLSLSFTNSDGQRLEMDFRAYDDGVAFRYRLPAGRPSQIPTLETESTEFVLPAEAKIWAAHFDSSYEAYYEGEMTAGSPSPPNLMWSFPLLYRLADSRHWALITEANLGTNYCGSRLRGTATNGFYSLALPKPTEANGHGAVKPSSPVPWEMPWRTIVLGDSLAAIVESTLVMDLNPPTRLQDTSWIRPGRVAWSWWSDRTSPQDGVKQKHFIDFAAQMGWEYVLVDANWTIMDNGNIHDVLRYAEQKGVGVLLWYNCGGPNNLVTQKPRDCLTYPAIRQFELSLLRKWGVKGIKVDFFMSDKQETIGLYEGILQDAAAQQIMVDFHGCTLPRGWERTFPNLMSMEAVCGEERYIFDPKFPEGASVQNTILPFTRNVVGPMDYTPGGLSTNKFAHLTTFAHELALTVLFETGWLHFVDSPESYDTLPAQAKQFMKTVPAAWDDTRFVSGYPGQSAILARRKGDLWFVAGVNGQNQPREETIKPGDWFGNSRYELTLLVDGVNAKTVAGETRQVDARQPFSVSMLPRGGFVAVLKPLK